MVQPSATKTTLSSLSPIEFKTYTEILNRRINERKDEIWLNGKISSVFDEIIAQTTEEYDKRMNQATAGTLMLEEVTTAQEQALELRLKKSYNEVNLSRDYSPTSVLATATHARVHSCFDFYGLEAEVITYTHDPYDTESEQELAEFFRTLRLSSGIRGEHILFSF